MQQVGSGTMNTQAQHTLGLYMAMEMLVCNSHTLLQQPCLMLIYSYSFRIGKKPFFVSDVKDASCKPNRKILSVRYRKYYTITYEKTKMEHTSSHIPFCQSSHVVDDKLFSPQTRPRHPREIIRASSHPVSSGSYNWDSCWAYENPNIRAIATYTHINFSSVTFPWNSSFEKEVIR